MNTIEFLPGQEIKQLGTVQRLYFTDLFEANYVIDDQVVSASDIKHKIIASKEILVERLFKLILTNEKLVFKFLNKLMIATKSIPLINILNSKIIKIKSEIHHMDFDWECYNDYISIQQKLKDFIFTYYTKKLD